MPKNTLILIYGRKYWNEVLNLKGMLRWGTISQSDFDQLQYADTVDEAFDKIRAGLEKIDAVKIYEGRQTRRSLSRL